MAFNEQSFSRISTSANNTVTTLQNGTFIGAPAVYTYITASDLQVTIAAANYFLSKIFELNQGDFIWAVDANGVPEQYIVVLVDIPNKSVQISNASTAAGDVIGTPPTFANALARYTNVGGLVIKNSNLTLSDANVFAAAGAATGDFTFQGGTTPNSGLASGPNANGDAGNIKLWNPAGTFYYGVKAGAQLATTLYTAPIAFPAADGYVLSCTTAGIQSWVPNGAAQWVDQTATPVTVTSNISYSANTAGLLTFNMPATAAFGDEFEIAGNGAGGWLLQMNAGQTANLGSTPTTVAGSIASTNRYDCVKLVCTVANTTFTVKSSEGTLVLA